MIKNIFLVNIFLLFLFTSIINNTDEKFYYAIDSGLISKDNNKIALNEKIVLPIEVLGAEGVIESRKITIGSNIHNSASKLWFMVNNLSYENKGSVKINNGNWLPLNHSTVEMETPELARGGMVYGGFNTIRFTIPSDDLKQGENTLQFRFDTSDAISNGYRIIRLNILDLSGNKLLDDSFFEEDDPASWEAPFTDATSIAEGEDLWRNGILWSNYLPQGRKGFWYDHDIGGSAPMRAKCASCHTQDGRDLEIFSYSNKSIVERAKFHKLTEDQGKKIASYIRSLSETHENVGRYGRPWNPPYQPGTELIGKPIEQWAAGAGIDAVLDSDKDMKDYMFPNGVNQEEVYKYFDSEKLHDRTIVPISLQFPDWKHWLPIIHPIDAFNKNDYWENPVDYNGKNYDPEKYYSDIRDYLKEMPLINRNKEELMDKIDGMYNQFGGFLGSGSWKGSKTGYTWDSLDDEVEREVARSSLAKLLAVKNFEIFNEFNLQDKASWFVDPADLPAKRQWTGKAFQVFHVPPHFTACSQTEGGGCQNFEGQSLKTGKYQSTLWYQVQSVINGGNGLTNGHNGPVDNNYHPKHILDAGGTSGLMEPLRYYQAINAMYQVKTWSGGINPNNGQGFRMRVMGPWFFYGIDENGTSAALDYGEFVKLLDKVEPGLTALTMNALLKQFLTEINKPHNSLDVWQRWAEGDINGRISNTLDPLETADADIPPNLPEGFRFGYWSHRLYYLIPKFAELGVDCEIINDLIDWCAEAWPNINWNVFRNSSTATLQLSQFSDDDNCTKYVSALTGNIGNTVTYEWFVNGVPAGNNSSELPKSEYQIGDLIRCKLTTNSNCSSNNQIIERSIKIVGYNITTTFNDAPLNNGSTIQVEENDNLLFSVEHYIKPILWLDAMSSTSIQGANNNEQISTWYDKSGNGFHGTASSDIAPTYDKEGLSGLPTIMFGIDEVADGLELFSTEEDDFFEEDWVIFVVGRFIGNDTFSQLMGNKAWNSRFTTSYAPNLKGPSSGASGAGGPGRANPFSFIQTLTKYDNTLSINMNGTVEAIEVSEPNALYTNEKAIYIGQADDGSRTNSRHFRGSISEVIVFDRKLMQEEQDYIEGYLAHKWNLSDRLANLHPFKKLSPEKVLNTPSGNKIVLSDNYPTKVSIEKESDYGSYSIQSENCTEPDFFMTASSNSSLNITNDKELGEGKWLLKSNPVENILEVEGIGMARLGRNYTISILDFSGKELFKSKIENRSADLTKQINVSALSSSIYLILVQSEDQTWVERFVKK